MKKIFTITFTITLMILAVSSFTLGQTGDEAAIIQLERDIYKAARQGDAKMLDRIWADEFTATFSGSVAIKQDLLANLPKSPDSSSSTANFSEMKARVFGDAAVLTGVITFKSKDAGKEDVRYSRFTDTFVRRKNGWQLVASQLDEVSVWQARKLEDTELKKLSALGCSGESSLKSLNSDVDTYIRFNNATAQTVVVNWLNFDGKRDASPYQKIMLKPGQTEFRYTYLTAGLQFNRQYFPHKHYRQYNRQYYERQSTARTARRQWRRDADTRPSAGQSGD